MSPDDVDDFDEAWIERLHLPPAEQRDQLRAALRQRTLGVVRRRGWVRRATWFASGAACFLAGMVTMRGLISPTESIAPPSITSKAKASVQIVAPPREVVLRTSDEAWRRLGDRAARDPRRIATTVQRYARSVALASPTGQTIDPQHDHWLLMALKLHESQEH